MNKKIIVISCILLLPLTAYAGFRLYEKTEKTTPIGTDIVGIEDSADSWNVKKIELQDLPISTAAAAKNATQDTAIEDKQDALISGTNIKTINSTPILGAGDITIAGGTVDATIIDGSTNPTTGDAIFDEFATRLLQSNLESILDGATLTGLTLDGTLTLPAATTLPDDSVGAAQLADGDLGDVSVSGGVVTVDVATGGMYVDTPWTYSDSACTSGQYALTETFRYDCIANGNINKTALTDWDSPAATYTLSLTLVGVLPGDSVNGISVAGPTDITGLSSATYALTEVFGGTNDTIVCAAPATGSNNNYTVDMSSQAQSGTCTFSVSAGETAVATDDFSSYSHASLLGSQSAYDAVLNDFITLNTTHARGNTISANNAVVSTATFNADQYSTALVGTISATGSYGAAARMSGADATAKFYAAAASGGGWIYLYSYDGSDTGAERDEIQSSNAYTPAIGDEIRIEATGTGTALRLTVKIKEDGGSFVNVFTDVDPVREFDTGEPGMYQYGNAGDAFDSWAAGNL